MSDVTPTRSAVVERKEERHAMHEGYVFLDEKTMLLAGEIVRQLRTYEAGASRFAAAQRAAVKALAAAVTQQDRKSTRLNSSHMSESRMPSSA